jgi:hypothetical protein
LTSSPARNRIDSAITASTGGPDSERRHRDQQPARAADDQQQREHEGQVIETGQNMVDAEQGVIPRHLPRVALRDHFEPRLTRPRDRGGLRAVEPDETRKDVGDGCLETVEADDRAVDRVGRYVDQAPVQRPVRQARDLRRAGRLPVLRQLQPRRMRFTVIGWRAPDDLVAFRRQLAQLERTRLQFVRRRLAGETRRQQ